MYPETDKIKKLVNDAQSIVIIQADNPDADSLGSALALEHILGDQGKKITLYCGVDMPAYLKYLAGWDRVNKELPKQFDLSIIVDASTMSLLEKLVESNYKGWLSTKPCIVLDHHEIVENPVPFASLTINDSTRASAGELIYILSKELDWPLSVTAQELIMSSILGDTQGLSNQLASSKTYTIFAEMLEAGVNRTELEELRRQYSKMPPEIYKYKAELISRTTFSSDGKVASVAIPQNEINTYSPLYNPGPLVQGDMLQTEGVVVAIVFKEYDDGKVTGAIRCNSGFPIAAELAEQFGGGGHKFAAGFKTLDNQDFEAIKSKCLDTAEDLLIQNGKK